MDQHPGVVMLMRKFYPLTGGYQNQALRLAQEMIKRNIKVYVITQRHGTLAPYEIYQQVPIHRVPAFRSGHLAALSYLLSAFLWMLRNRDKFQLIHANRSSSGLVAGLIGFVLRKKVLYKLTRGDEIDAKGFRTTLLGQVKVRCLKGTVGKFIAITKEMEKDLKDLGIPPSKIAKIPNGMSLNGFSEAFEGRQIKSPLGLSSETKIVTFVGRLVRAKGVDWLLEVWKDVARQERRGRLLIVGDGPERSALEAQAMALGIHDTVNFLGRQADVFRFLAITDIFVLPSRQEGVSNALLEAMSQGLPVVVADDALGGNLEVIDDQKEGYVIRLGDTRAFAEVLLKLLRDSGLRREMGRRARQKIEEKFSIESVASKYCETYNALLATPAGSEAN